MMRSKITGIVVVLLFLIAGVTLYFTRYSPTARRATHLARGESHYQSGEYDKAKLEYLVVLRSDLANRTGIERLGNIWLLQGVPAQAMSFLFRLKQLVPDDLANRRKIAAALVELGDFATARKEAEELLQRAPNDEETWITLAGSTLTKEIDSTEKRLHAAGINRPGMRYALAVLALKKRDLAAAERYLGEVLAQDDRFYRAHMAMADLHLLRRNNELAGQSLKIGSALAPLRSRERLRYTEYRALAGEFGDAKEAVKDVTVNAPDYLPGWVLLAKIAFAQKEIPEAQKALEKVFSRDPANYDGRLLEAELQIAKPDLKAAIEGLERLTKAYPSATTAKFQLGRAYTLANRANDALGVLQQAIGVNPNYVEAQVLLAEINLRAGQPQAVVETLGALIERQPDLARAELLLADAYRMLRRYEQAAAIYRRHADAAPQNPLPWIFLGTVYREEGREKEAIGAFEKASERAPNHLGIVNHLVELDLRRRDFASAAARLSRLDERTAASAPAKVLTARIQGAQEHWTQAEESLLAAIGSDPDHDAAYQVLVALYYDRGRFVDAIKRLEEKLARNPDDIGSRLLLARIQDEQKDYERARAMYEEALKRRPESIVALNNLAYLYSERLGQLPRALELAQKANVLQPADPFVADTLGWVRYRSGDFDGALVLLRESANKLAERGEVPAEVNYHLGMTLLAMGQTDAAAGSLTKAAASARDFAGKAAIPLKQELLRYSPAQPGNLTVERLLALGTAEPGDPFLQLRVGEALEGAKRYPEAITAYERVLALNPKFATAAANLARMHLVANPAKALEYAKGARDLAPADPAIAANLGVTVSQMGDHAWAYSLLQQAVAQANPAPGVLFEFGRVAYRLGKSKEAKNAFERALASAQTRPIAESIRTHLRMLQIIDQRSVDAAALQEVAAAHEKDPNSLVSRVAEAVLMERKSDWVAAGGAYREILKKHPAFPIAQARLAAVQLQVGNWNEALELASAARKAMPEDPLAALVLGETSFRNKDYRRAADYFAEGARSEPLNARQLFMMGASYFGLQDRSRSESALKHAIKEGLPDAERSEAERMLKQLGG
jgi:tetratricopeptide (TPR) repeat protein